MGVPSTFSSRTKTARPLASWPVTTVRTFIPCLFSSGLFMVTFLDSCNFVFIFNFPFGHSSNAQSYGLRFTRLSRIETQIGHGQRSAALLMIIVMLVHYPRSIPFPECAPTQSARPTEHPDQVECPLRMRLACSVSRHRGLSNGYLQTADFGHYVKRNQEAEEKRAHSCLSANHFFLGFAAYLDIIGVKGVEDPKMLFEAFADVGLDDSRV